MSFRLKIQNEHLPRSFENVIVDSQSSDDQIIIRTNVNNMDGIRSWVKEFSVLTDTKWNAEKSFPHGKAMICRKQYVCHHSAFQKVDRDKNKRGISKNANCKAKLNCKIKISTVDTRKRDPFMKQGLCAIVTIDTLHSHTLKTAEAFYFLPADEGIQENFFDYFNDGMTLPESRTYHEELEGATETSLANSRINPTYRTVKYWYDEWRLLNLGPRTGDGVLKKLQEKVNTYSEEGILVRFSEHPFVVVIITPLMKRAHNIMWAKDIVFCDSSSSCDDEQHTITFLLTPCPAGAAPLGILITQGQSEDSYTAAFQLLKNSLLEIGIPGFGQQGYPRIFLTDNSQAEIKALKSVWPMSENLLCKFHVLQAVWRWLLDSKNGVLEAKRQALMYSFKELMHADLNDILSKYDAAKSMLDDEGWTTYLEKYWSFKEKWIIAFRDHTIRGHHTNNYSEVCVRIFKDNILSRVRAYNVIALIDFVCSSLEKFYTRKFRDFSNFRSSSQRLFLTNTLRKCAYIKEKDDIVKLNEHVFIVPSQKDSNTYTVDTNVGMCTCPQGVFGRFCKHEAAVYKFYDVQSFNFPPITDKHRYEMVFLATGDKSLQESFYQPLLASSNEEGQQGFLLQEEASNDRTLENPSTITENENNEMEENKDTEALQEEILKLLQDKLSRIPSEYDDLLKFKKRLERINTEGQLATFLCTAGSQNISLTRRRTGSYIHVQPTSKSRRRPQLTRGSKRFPAGRPPKGPINGQLKKAPRKRKHNLAQNIRNNVPNAKF